MYFVFIGVYVCVAVCICGAVVLVVVFCIGGVWTYIWVDRFLLVVISLVNFDCREKKPKHMHNTTQQTTTKNRCLSTHTQAQTKSIGGRQFGVGIGWGSRGTRHSKGDKAQSGQDTCIKYMYYSKHDNYRIKK